jgi:hypothetical protein
MNDFVTVGCVVGRSCAIGGSLLSAEFSEATD